MLLVLTVYLHEGHLIVLHGIFVESFERLDLWLGTKLVLLQFLFLIV